MPSSKPIRDAIEMVEAEASRQNQIETLCGEIVATLVINRDRGAFVNIEHKDAWSEWIAKWQDKLKELRST